MKFRHHTAALFILAATVAARADSGQSRIPAAIDAGRRALLESISDNHEIRYRPAEGQHAVTVRGKIDHDAGATLEFTTMEGKRVRISKKLIIRWTRAGHVYPEWQGRFFGGPSSLAAIALLAAGVQTTDPTLTLLLEALAADDPTPAGTYVRSLRATLWSALLDRPISRAHRTQYTKFLRNDMQWLQKAMRPDGSFTYDLDATMPGDNSNAQFAILGLWAGSVARVETSAKLWRSLEGHWKSQQEPDGGWSYNGAIAPPTPSMTVAGCNSLYIILDRFYTRAEGQYALFEGTTPKRNVREKMRALYAAIEAGDKFLAAHPPNVRQFMGYELFGLERLGIASGRASVGRDDWFLRYADEVAGREWRKDVIADAFALIFLVHGQAPILIQKLEHGSVDDWNYYHRDMYSLLRWLSHSFERLYRWQRIPVDASLAVLQDAPILYISGQEPLELPVATMGRIREYLDAGGTLFLHADRASAKFTRTAAALFEGLYKDRGLKFTDLDADHPVFRCYYGGADSPWKRAIRLKGMSDGSRVFAFLCPVDIAGAWHQDRSDRFEELFRIMANVRTYAAPPYSELPSRADPRGPIGSPVPAWRDLRIARLRHGGDWNAHPSAWSRYAPGLRHRTGLSLAVLDPIDAGALDPAGCDILYVSARSSVALDDAGRAAVDRFMQAGGLVLVDAADGTADGLKAVRTFVDACTVGRRGVLPANHPIAAGAVRYGKPLLSLHTTQAGASLVRADTPPPILTLELDGRIVLLACPFDIAAALDGHFIWNRSGFLPEDTARMVDNIFSWRAGGPNPATTRASP